MKNVMKKLNKKGFTLAELLIVVAIIAVLVAISIPVFNSQLEKARDSADAANLRAQYAEMAANAITEETDQTSDGVAITGTKAGFGNIEDIAGVSTSTDTVLKGAIKGQTITVTVSASDGSVTFAVKP